MGTQCLQSYIKQRFAIVWLLGSRLAIQYVYFACIRVLRLHSCTRTSSPAHAHEVREIAFLPETRLTRVVGTPMWSIIKLWRLPSGTWRTHGLWRSIAPIRTFANGSRVLRKLFYARYRSLISFLLVIWICVLSNKGHHGTVDKCSSE